MPDPSDLLTPAEAARMARISVRTLRRYRQLGQGPKVAGYVGRSPRFRRSDVLVWIQEGRAPGGSRPS
jgi:DNA-binding transcriptional MerR regulator